jgi:hypothetical protein
MALPKNRKSGIDYSASVSLANVAESGVEKTNLINHSRSRAQCKRTLALQSVSFEN